MQGPAAPSAGLPGQQFSLQTLVSVIQQAVQAQNLIATNIKGLTTEMADIAADVADLVTAFSAAFPPPITGSAAYTPSLLANGASATTTIVVTGAALGNYVDVNYSISQAGLILSAYVSAANTVTVVFANLTGGSVTLGAGTINVKVHT